MSSAFPTASPGASPSSSGTRPDTCSARIHLGLTGQMHHQPPVLFLLDQQEHRQEPYADASSPGFRQVSSPMTVLDTPRPRPSSTMMSVDRQVPLRIRKFLEGPPRPSTTTGPEQGTTMTVDMYHYTALKRQDRPGYCQVPLRFRNATSTTTTLEDLGSIKFDYQVCTTTAAVSFDKTSCASTSTTVPVITDER
ncbi:hypothetical protein VPH35_020852 [Triticum aestivum]